MLTRMEAKTGRIEPWRMKGEEYKIGAFRIHSCLDHEKSTGKTCRRR